MDGQVLGEREFDGWGRVTRLSRGDVSETYQYEDASNVPKTRTGADGITLAFEYFPELGNEVKSVTGKDAKDKELGKQTFSYRHGKTRKSSASEGSQTITFDHDINERVTQQHGKLKDKVESTLSRSSSQAGRLLSETDAVGNQTTFAYNNKGQRSRVDGAGSSTTHSYDERGRLGKDTITLGNDELTVSYSYDTSDHELRRQFTLTDAFDLSLKRTFSGEGRLQSIKLYDEKARKDLGSHSYTYTVGGALAS
ncbi:hypothetical protein GQL56_27945, partial [Pseudomonas putida]|nr:hypothetical protein [Pseudomonas putida]